MNKEPNLQKITTKGTALPEHTPQILPTLCRIDTNFPYNIVIPAEFERKIRLLCSLSPDTEWSGILFYEPKGKFEKSLDIVCKDILLMDVGTATYTEIDWETPEIAKYMVNNLELFDCKMGLIHSHNKMATFFSGTDQSTLRKEGNDMNVFVSLIVNNDGEYTAGITKRVTDAIDRTITDQVASSYAYYEGVTVHSQPFERTAHESLEKTIINWYNLNIVKDIVSEEELKVLTPEEISLQERFYQIQEEVRSKKAKYTPSVNNWWENTTHTGGFFWNDTLFDKTPKKESTPSQINWSAYPGIRKAFWWFITGSPWAPPRYSLPEIWKVFPTEYQCLDWFSKNLEYIITNLDLFGLDRIEDDYHMEDMEITAAVIERFKKMLPDPGTSAHDLIMQVLDYYSL